MRRTIAVLATIVAVALSLSPATRVEAQALPSVNGAGSTWSQNALDQWRADVSRSGLKINYQGVGSTSGRTLFTQGQLDFAVSEIPFQPGEATPNFRFVYLPIVAGGTSVMYRVKGTSGQQITNLRLSSNLTAQIFTRKITKWNDPAIARENPGVPLPNKDITVVVRSDGSGTSYQFSAYLRNREPALWREFAQANRIPDQPTSTWPTLTGASAQPFSDGVANYVARGDGAITYVEASYAIERRVPVAAIRNAAGNYVLPTSDNVAFALSRATINADRTQNLGGVYTIGGSGYPISSYSYMIAKTSGISEDKGRVIARFVYYFACAGQRKAAPLGYSPLPANLVKAAFEAIVTVPGAEKPPVIAPATCANPYVTGSVTVPGGSAATTTTTAPAGGGNGGNAGAGNGSGSGGTSGNGAGAGGSGSGTGSGAEGGTTGDGAAAGDGSTTGALTDGTAIDIDGDGQADGIDADGDGIVDATLDGTEVAAATRANPSGSVEIDGDAGSSLPLVLGTICLIALIVIPPILLTSGAPGNRWWHRAFRS
jgi:phosphate transport system substrate-binding protein